MEPKFSNPNFMNMMGDLEQQDSQLTPEEFEAQLNEFSEDMPAGSAEMFFQQMQEAFQVNQMYDEKERMFLEASRSLSEEDFDDDDFYNELSDLLDGHIER